MKKFTQVGSGDYHRREDGSGYLSLTVHLDGEPRTLLVFRDRQADGRQYVVLSPHRRDRATDSQPAARSAEPATDETSKPARAGDGRTEAESRTRKVRRQDGRIIEVPAEDRIPF